MALLLKSDRIDKDIEMMNRIESGKGEKPRYSLFFFYPVNPSKSCYPVLFPYLDYQISPGASIKRSG